MLAAMAVDPADERRHPAGAGPAWEESWYFDWAAGDGSVGGFVRLGLHPAQGTAWYWACVVGDGRRPAMVVDHDVPLPRGRSLEVRAEGLWADHVCETPLDHWTLGAEAFAVALDEPLDAYGAGWGDRVPFGVDLEWETDGPCSPHRSGAGYGVPCRVSGEVIVGDEHVEVDAWGHRSHAWGDRDWWSAGWWWAAGRLDGAPFCATGPSGPAAAGPATLPGPTTVAVGDPPAAVTARPVGFAPVLVVAPDGRRSRLARALCRFAGPGRAAGSGWAEWNSPVLPDPGGGGGGA
jgi:hypothetical protein